LEFVTLGDGELYPLKEIDLEIDCQNFVLLLPGFVASLKFELFENGNLTEKKSSIITLTSKNRLKIRSFFKRHGNFDLKNFSLLIKDFFGLTIYEINLNFNHTISIKPYFLKEIEMPIFTSEGGDRVIQSVKKINSQDFFDNRKYYPGDDIRRINWKVFAHIDELHVRQEEKIPPKIGEVSLYFLPYSDNCYEYEYICSLFLSTAHFLIKNGYSLKIFTPQKKIVEPQNEKDIYEIINNGYFKFDDKIDFTDSVVFCSFFQMDLLINKMGINNSFFSLSYFNSKINNRYLFELIIKVSKYDNLLKEIYNTILVKKNTNRREKRLKSLEETIRAKNSLVDVYETKSEDAIFKIV